MSDEIKTTKVSRKTILPYIVKMDEHLKALSGIVAEMPDCSAKKSFETSMVNINKKYDNYTSASAVVIGEKLTDEEKEMLEKFRAEKAQSLEQTEENTVSPDEVEQEQTGKRKKKH